MKSLLKGILLVLVILLVAGCTPKENAKEQGADTPAVTESDQTPSEGDQQAAPGTEEEPEPAEEEKAGEAPSEEDSEGEEAPEDEGDEGEEGAD